jgi:hypothetical protein
VSYDCYCDYDPADFYVKCIRTARKQHRCEECSGLILPGDKYEYVSGKWEGCLSTFKTCEQCVDLRTWTKNNVPCLCWAHGNMVNDCEEAVQSAWERAPTETVGLRFGFIRRRTERDKFHASRRP